MTPSDSFLRLFTVSGSAPSACRRRLQRQRQPGRRRRAGRRQPPAFAERGEQGAGGQRRAAARAARSGQGHRAGGSAPAHRHPPPAVFFPAGGAPKPVVCASRSIRRYFMAYSDLRIHLEAAYWEEAARRLTAEDHQELKRLVARAWEKLNGQPIQIPHPEHRQLHLGIYRRLDNPFVYGLAGSLLGGLRSGRPEPVHRHRLSAASMELPRGRWCEAICDGDYRPRLPRP